MAKPKYSKEIQDWLDAGNKIKVISPEETAKTLKRQSGGYFKARSVMGPSKKKGKSSWWHLKILL